MTQIALAGVLWLVISVSGIPAMAAEIDTTISTRADCDSSGIVFVYARLRNNEDKDLSVTVNQETKVVAPGEWAEWQIELGPPPQPGGTVEYHVAFADGSNGTATETDTYSSEEECETPTPTPSATVSPTESPPPSETVSPTESPTPSETVAPTVIKTSPPPTKAAPKKLAFTGRDDVPWLMGISLLLALVGSTTLLRARWMKRNP
jgi:hypothetical protein